MIPELHSRRVANLVTSVIQRIFQPNTEVRSDSGQAPAAFQPASIGLENTFSALGMTKFFQKVYSLNASGLCCEENFAQHSVETDVQYEGLKLCLGQGFERSEPHAGIETGLLNACLPADDIGPEMETEVEELQDYGGSGCDNICRTSCDKACEDDSADPKKCKERCAQDKEICGCGTKKPVS